MPDDASTMNADSREDRRDEQMRPVAEIAAEYTGREPSSATVSRQCLHGIRIGEQTIRIDGALRTGRGWVCASRHYRAFLEAITAAARKHVEQHVDAPIERTPAVEDALRQQGLI